MITNKVEYVREQNGKRILAANRKNKNHTTEKEHRQDGYRNLLNKYGTNFDSSIAYVYEKDEAIPDWELTDQYESNGLFAKIIDAPAEEAVKRGYDFKLNDPGMQDFVEKELDRLDWEEIAATAIKWSRLYGGALIVMIVDDGRYLEDPLDWEEVKELEELMLYERAIVEPEYTSLYTYNPEDTKKYGSRFQTPEFYTVNSQFGRFRVHASRCLIFRNGKLPESSMQLNYRFFGIPEMLRLQHALRSAITDHSNSGKLLERCVQSIYKMKGLAQILATADGEDKVLQRLEIIDLARGILSTLLIDSDGEDYHFENMNLSGVKDILESSCNMLSALTNIPQTILFGRSPAGQNSTGESDLENYYNYIERIQKTMLKKNMRILLDIIFECGRRGGEISKIPAYKVEFVPLWSLSEAEQANVDSIKAATEQAKATTAQTYVDMQALDPSEVRAGLKRSEEYTINDLLNEEDDLDIVSLLGLEPKEKTATQKRQEEHQALMEDIVTDEYAVKGRTAKGVGILVISNGKILAGDRDDGMGLCGPGGHIEEGETAKEAAHREAFEEFGIQVKELIPLGYLTGMPKKYIDSYLYLCTDYEGVPKADGEELQNAQFFSMDELRKKKLFLPFLRSLEYLKTVLSQDKHVRKMVGKHE